MLVMLVLVHIYCRMLRHCGGSAAAMRVCCCVYPDTAGLTVLPAYSKSLLVLVSDGMRVMSVTVFMTLHQLPEVQVSLNTIAAGQLVPPFQPCRLGCSTLTA